MNKGMFGFPERFRDESFHSFPKKKVSGESFFGFPSGNEDYDFKFNVTSTTKTKVIVLNSDNGGITTVDWGDGSTTRYTMQPTGSSISHIYEREGIYLVNIYGETEKVSALNINSTNSIGIRNNFSKFPNIKDINIGNNGFNTSIPQISNLYNLTIFNASFCGFSGNIPSFSNSPLLKTLGLAGNSLTGILPNIGVNTNLEVVYLNLNTGLIGEIPFMGNCLNLNTFHCYLCGLNGILPDFSNCLLLSSFRIYNNQFSGILPSFSTNTALSDFQINNNQFSGNLPSFNNLTNLVTFNCSDNQFSGNIPTFSGCTSLQNFTAGGGLNAWTGTVPYFPASLKILSINQATLTALIYPEDLLTNLIDLTDFDILRNKIDPIQPNLPTINTNTKLVNYIVNDPGFGSSGQNFTGGTIVFNTQFLQSFQVTNSNINFDFTNLSPSTISGGFYISINHNGQALTNNFPFPWGTKIGSRSFNVGNNSIDQINMDFIVSSGFSGRVIYGGFRAFTLGGNNAVISGVYQQPLGFNNDLTEIQITDISILNNWTPKEKLWVLVNCKISSTNSTPRYNWGGTFN